MKACGRRSARRTCPVPGCRCGREAGSAPSGQVDVEDDGELAHVGTGLLPFPAQDDRLQQGTGLGVDEAMPLQVMQFLFPDLELFE
jgi:hypothetical protein